MAQKSPLNRFVTEQSERLFKTMQLAKKVTTPPLGMEQVAKRTLRERFPHIGTEARRAFRLRLAAENKDPQDPSGSKALMALLESDDAN